MARDDWRIRIELESGARGFLERLGVDISSRASKLADELSSTARGVARRGHGVRLRSIGGGGRTGAHRRRRRAGGVGHRPRRGRAEHWLDDEDRWDLSPTHRIKEEELVARGYAPEVRVDCGSHERADRLADELEADGFEAGRRWTYLVVGARTREEAEALAERVHGQVEAGGELVWEVMPRNPFAVFGGLGG